ncbi:hypothetical protein [Paraburkholderia megapolitana]|uniref:hypothetical protein n=1 Tax=Paraburkholderia megapolitana TaxID=420953 RepID=UPI0038B77B12
MSAKPVIANDFSEPLFRQWVDSIDAAADALHACRERHLIRMGIQLEIISRELWRRGDGKHCEAAIQMRQLSVLVLTPGDVE